MLKKLIKHMLRAFLLYSLNYNYNYAFSKCRSCFSPDFFNFSSLAYNYNLSQGSFTKKLFQPHLFFLYFNLKKIKNYGYATDFQKFFHLKFRLIQGFNFRWNFKLANFSSLWNFRFKEKPKKSEVLFTQPTNFSILTISSCNEVEPTENLEENIHFQHFFIRKEQIQKCSIKEEETTKNRLQDLQSRIDNIIKNLEDSANQINLKMDQLFQEDGCIELQNKNVRDKLEKAAKEINDDINFRELMKREHTAFLNENLFKFYFALGRYVTILEGASGQIHKNLLQLKNKKDQDNAKLLIKRLNFKINNLLSGKETPRQLFELNIPETLRQLNEITKEILYLLEAKWVDTDSNKIAHRTEETSLSSHKKFLEISNPAAENCFKTQVQPSKLSKIFCCCLKIN